MKLERLDCSNGEDKVKDIWTPNELNRGILTYEF